MKKSFQENIILINYKSLCDVSLFSIQSFYTILNLSIVNVAFLVRLFYMYICLIYVHLFISVHVF